MLRGAEVPEWLNVKAFSAGAAGVFLLYYIVSMLYYLYIHPLRIYPGPKVFAISRIPITYGIITGNSVHWIRDLHERFGPIVRVAPTELSYSDSRAWKDIHASYPTRRGGMPRDVGFLKAIEDGSGIPTILTANNDDHARIRRAYAPAFSKQTLIAQESMIVRHVDLLIRKLYETEQTPTNMVDMFTFTLFDIQVNLQFGESLRLLEDAKYAPWVSSQRGWTRASISLAALADFPWMKRILAFTIPKLVKKQRDEYFNFSSTKIDHRFSTEVEKPDITETVSQMGQRSLSEADIRANAPVFIIAGNDTTSSLLSGLTANLLNKPVALKKLIEEIRATFKDESEINMAGMNQLTFLDACIKETLRVYPALPSPIPRIVPEPGAEISGKWVPGGTRVYSSPLSTFRSSANFHEPDSFTPERWLAESGELFSADNKAAYRPFSIGPRDCIGQDMAYYLARLIFCKLILRFDLELCPESKDWLSNQRVWIVWDKPPLLLKLIPLTPHPEDLSCGKKASSVASSCSAYKRPSTTGRSSALS